MKIKLLAFLMLLGSGFVVEAQTRTEILLEKNWKFTRKDDPEFIASDYKDQWQTITVPPNWREVMISSNWRKVVISASVRL